MDKVMINENLKISQLTVKEFRAVIASEISKQDLPEILIDRKEAAQLANVHYHTITNWGKIGRIRLETKNGKPYYFLSEIKEIAKLKQAKQN